jgi:hypothetical protein
MAGKSFAVVEVEGKAYSVIASWSGGATNPKTREVPEAAIGGTMREEPTGGVMREDIELGMLEREDEGLLLDELHDKLTKWRDERDRAKRRKQLTLTFYSDREFTKATGRLNVIGAWPKVVSTIEFDRSSDDARTFTTTLTHLGSEYKRQGAVGGLAPGANPIAGGSVSV